MPDRLVRIPGRRPNRKRFAQRLILLVFAVSTFGGLFTSSPAPTVRGDELADAYARQTQLEKLIKTQKSSIASLNASQANLAQKIGFTKDSLAQINADL